MTSGEVTDENMTTQLQLVRISTQMFILFVSNKQTHTHIETVMVMMVN